MFSFYEWQQNQKSGTKQPYYIQFKSDRPDDKGEHERETTLGEERKLLTMAGLFDCRKPPKEVLLIIIKCFRCNL